jgi:hypothetical protein
MSGLFAAALANIIFDNVRFGLGYYPFVLRGWCALWLAFILALNQERVFIVNDQPRERRRISHIRPWVHHLDNLIKSDGPGINPCKGTQDRRHAYGR